MSKIPKLFNIMKKRINFNHLFTNKKNYSIQKTSKSMLNLMKKKPFKNMSIKLQNNFKTKKTKWILMIWQTLSNKLKNKSKSF